MLLMAKKLSKENNLPRKSPIKYKAEAKSDTQSQVVIFSCPHFRKFHRAGIFVAGNMENTMRNNPVKFIIKISFKLSCILPDSLNTNQNIAGNFPAAAIIKCNNISVVIAAEKFQINITEVPIGAEDNRDLPGEETFTTDNKK
jgi:hypothetical protein